MKLHRMLFPGMIFLASAIKAQLPQRYDIVIDEIMADPTPVIGLPSVEYIEVKNISGRNINLSGWKLKTSTSSSGAFPNYVLPSDSLVLICSNASAAPLSAFGKVISVNSFPALDNDGSVLSLASKEGFTIHAVSYESSWHSDKKTDGGWSLEMIDTRNPCTGKNNWMSSSDSKGGSPGKINAVNGVVEDNMPPRLIRSYSLDSTNIVAVFDEPVDSMMASNISNLSFSHQINIVFSQPQPPLFQQIHIRLSSPMQKGIIYQLKVKQIQDCKGNEIGIHHSAKSGIGENILTREIVVNEIMFNPRPNAFDYLELYNNSERILDVSTLNIASKNAEGVITQPKKITEQQYYIFPQEYLILTKDKSSLQHEYLVKNPDQILSCILPSFPDDKGTVILMNAQGRVIDELSYSAKWHFALISNDEGISLERIDPSSNSQDKENWHSASATSGFGTPGYQNSQFKHRDILKASITINANVISPDNDGLDDFATIDFEVESSGYLANVDIFSSDGKLISRFKKNELLGMKGSWQWDGLGENKNKLDTGIYIVYTEIFNLKGIKKVFKNTIVLKRAFN